jgi:hypothetical protein
LGAPANESSLRKKSARRHVFRYIFLAKISGNSITPKRMPLHPFARESSKVKKAKKAKKAKK